MKQFGIKALLLLTIHQLHASDMISTHQVIDEADNVLFDDGSSIIDGENIADALVKKRAELKIREEAQLAALRLLEGRTEKVNKITTQLEQSCLSTRNTSEQLKVATRAFAAAIDELRAQELQEARAGQLNPADTLLIQEFEANNLGNNDDDDDNPRSPARRAYQGGLVVPQGQSHDYYGVNVGRIAAEEIDTKTRLQQTIHALVQKFEERISTLKETNDEAENVKREKIALIQQTRANLRGIEQRLLQVAKMHNGVVAEELVQELEAREQAFQNDFPKSPPSSSWSLCTIQ